MNQVESTKLFHRADTLQRQFIDVLEQLHRSESQFTECTKGEDGSDKYPEIETLTELDSSVRIHSSAVISVLASVIKSELAFLDLVKIQCIQEHSAIPTASGRAQ